MPLDADIEVTRQIEDRTYGRDNIAQPFIRVEFWVGKHGPFTEKIEKTDTWDEERDRRVNAAAAKVRVQYHTS
jgi:hypothetical protein